MGLKACQLRKMLVMTQFEVYLDTIFSSENSRNLHLLHEHNSIVAKSLLESLEKESVVQFKVNLIKVCPKECYCSQVQFIEF